MGRDSLQTHAISYDSQYNPIDYMSRVLRHTDGLNLSNSCVSVALFLITRLSADQSTFVGYPSEDYRRYSIDSVGARLGWILSDVGKQFMEVVYKDPTSGRFPSGHQFARKLAASLSF